MTIKEVVQMPWKDKTVEELRKEFVEAAKTAKNFSLLCREFAITRKTGYKWIERDRQGSSLSDRSHAPLFVPHRTDVEIERAILQVRAENPEWGARTIRRFLENNGYTNLPCDRTVNNILQRYGCISEEESQKRTAFIRFEREHCNDLWQTDFKGDFPMLDGNRCFPLDILDDHSRYCLGIFPKTSATGVKQCFESVFSQFGLPKAILSDNGAQFAGFKGGYTQFERWLMDLDVAPIHGRILHPQTQGKIERFHRTMKNELLKYHTFTDIEHATTALEQWKVKYNEVRPHAALNMRCPADIYIPSTREYPKKILPYEYSGVYRMIKVNNWGYLRFDDIRVYLSETMADTYLEIRPSENDLFLVCYRNYQIAEIDAVTGTLLNRRIARLP